MTITPTDVENLIADIQRDLTIAKAKLVTLTEWAAQLPQARPRPHGCRRCTRAFPTVEERDEHEQTEHTEIRQPPPGPRELPGDIADYLAKLKGGEPELPPELEAPKPEPALTPPPAGVF